MATKQADSDKPVRASGMAAGVHKFVPDRFARADAALAGGANPNMLDEIRSGSTETSTPVAAVPEVPPMEQAAPAVAPAPVAAPAPVPAPAPVVAPAPVPAPAPVVAPAPAPASVVETTTVGLQPLQEAVQAEDPKVPTPTMSSAPPASASSIAAMVQAAAAATTAAAAAATAVAAPAPTAPAPAPRMTQKIAKARGGVVSETYSVTVEDSQAIDAMRVRATTLTNRILNRSEVVRLGLMLLQGLTDEQASELVKLLPNLATRRGR